MPLPVSDFQSLLEGFACRFLVLVEGVGVDVQCGGWLGVTQQSGYLDEFCFRFCRRSFGQALLDRLTLAVGSSVRLN